MIKISQPLPSKNLKDYHKKHYDKVDYYTEEGKRVGTWYGKGADSLELEGTINKDEYEAVIDGNNPNDGSRLRSSGGPKTYIDKRTGERKKTKERAGWDITFTVPKSVSVMLLVGEDKRIQPILDEAVHNTITRIEKDIYVRDRGKRINTGNGVFSLYEHNTSRALDPLWHKHVVLANTSQRNDGTWRGIEPSKLYKNQKYYTSYFHAEVSYKLAQLGYDIKLDPNSESSFDIVGFDQEHKEFFSKRRFKEIFAFMDKNGMVKPEGLEHAQVQTRKYKEEISEDVLLPLWKKDANNIGLIFSNIQGYKGPELDNINIENEKFIDRKINNKNDISDDIKSSDDNNINVINAEKKANDNIDEKSNKEDINSNIKIGKDDKKGPINEDSNAIKYIGKAIKKDSKTDNKADDDYSLSAAKFAVSNTFEKRIVASYNEIEYEATSRFRGKINPERVSKHLLKMIKDGELIKLKGEENVFTTRSAINDEHYIINNIDRGNNKFKPVKSYSYVPSLSFHKLDIKHRNAVKNILKSNDQFVGVYGKKDRYDALREMSKEMIKSNYNTKLFAHSKQDANKIGDRIGIESKSIFSLLNYSKKRPMKLTDRIRKIAGLKHRSSEVWIIDQAEKISNKDMKEIIDMSSKMNARVVFTGDKLRNKGFAAGSPFSWLIQNNKIKNYSLYRDNEEEKNVVRKSEKLISEGSAKESLEFLRKNNKVRIIDQKTKRNDMIADEFVKDKLNTVVVVQSKKDKDKINDLIREKLELKGNGKLFNNTLAVNLTDTEKRYALSYKEGYIIKNFATKGIDKIQSEAKVVSVDEDSNTITLSHDVERKILGKKTKNTVIKLDELKSLKYGVYKTEKIELTKNENVVFKQNIDTAIHEGNEKTRINSNIKKYQKGIIYDYNDKNITVYSNGKVHKIDAENISLDHSYVEYSTAFKPSHADRIIASYNSKSKNITHSTLYTDVTKANNDILIFVDDYSKFAANFKQQDTRAVSKLEYVDPDTIKKEEIFLKAASAEGIEKIIGNNSDEHLRQFYEEAADLEKVIAKYGYEKGEGKEQIYTNGDRSLKVEFDGVKQSYMDVNTGETGTVIDFLREQKVKDIPEILHSNLDHPRASTSYAIHHLFNRQTRTSIEDIKIQSLSSSPGIVRDKDIDNVIKSRINSGNLKIVEDGVVTEEAYNDEKNILNKVKNGLNKFDNLLSNLDDESLKYLEEDQYKAINKIADSKHQYMVFYGKPGTGKTTALKELVDGLQSESYDVKAYGLTGSASVGLNKAGINGQTLQTLLTKGPTDTSGQVWLIDEAGMASRSQIKSVIEMADKVDARVIWVGDHKQHSGVGAGRPFSLVQRAIEPVKLDIIKRQRPNPDLLEAVNYISEGDTVKSWEILVKKDSVKEYENIDEALLKASKEYVKDPTNSILMTPLNKTRNDLNDIIRSELELKDKGLTKDILEQRSLTPMQTMTVGTYNKGDYIQFFEKNLRGMSQVTKVDTKKGKLTVEFEDNGKTETISAGNLNKVAVYSSDKREFSVGDLVQFREKNRNHDIVARQDAWVKSVDTSGMEVLTTDNRTIKLSNKELRHLDYGYVVTSQVSQGKGAKNAIIVADTSKKATEIAADIKTFLVGASRGIENLSIHTDSASSIHSIFSQQPLDDEHAVDLVDNNIKNVDNKNNNINNNKVVSIYKNGEIKMASSDKKLKPKLVYKSSNFSANKQPKKEINKDLLKDALASEFIKFKENINLISYAENALGYKQCTDDKTQWEKKGQATIAISKNTNGQWVYRAWSQDKTGSIIDLIQDNTGNDYGTIRRHLRDYTGSKGLNKEDFMRAKVTPKHVEPVNTINSKLKNVPKIQEDFSKLKYLEYSKYLEDRGIEKDTLNMPEFKNAFKVDNRSNIVQPLRASGIDGVVGIHRKNYTYDRIDKGSIKGVCRSNPVTNPDNVVITESVIDFLSYSELHKDQKNIYISTGGNTSELTSKSAGELANHFAAKGAKILLATDNDEPADKIDSSVKTHIKGEYKNSIVIAKPPSRSKDWNEELLKVKGIVRGKDKSIFFKVSEFDDSAKEELLSASQPKNSEYLNSFGVKDVYNHDYYKDKVKMLDDDTIIYTYNNAYQKDPVGYETNKDGRTLNYKGNLDSVWFSRTDNKNQLGVVIVSSPEEAFAHHSTIGKGKYSYLSSSPSGKFDKTSLNMILNHYKKSGKQIIIATNKDDAFAEYISESVKEYKNIKNENPGKFKTWKEYSKMDSALTKKSNANDLNNELFNTYQRIFTEFQGRLRGNIGIVNGNIVVPQKKDDKIVGYAVFNGKSVKLYGEQGMWTTKHKDSAGISLVVSEKTEDSLAKISASGLGPHDHMSLPSDWRDNKSWLNSIKNYKSIQIAEPNKDISNEISNHLKSNLKNDINIKKVQPQDHNSWKAAAKAYTQKFGFFRKKQGYKSGV